MSFIAEESLCAYCGKQAEGEYSIHRDGFGVGPVVHLCNDCGKDELPSCEDIWDRIAEPSTEEFAHKRVAVLTEDLEASLKSRKRE